jgi:hypothetical protein
LTAVPRTARACARVWPLSRSFCITLVCAADALARLTLGREPAKEDSINPRIPGSRR